MKPSPVPVRVFVLAISLCGVALCSLLIREIRSAAGVLANQDLIIDASVPVCNLILTARPADRIPATGNWSTDLTVRVADLGGIEKLAFTKTSNNQGEVTFDMCANSIAITPGTYNFFVRGFSHLRKKFPAVESFTNYNTSVLFTAPSQYLIAGETSVIFDNFINGLDLSTQVVALYSNDEKNDLNQDNVVNALDLSITVKNLYAQGD